ncbi:MAG: NTPase [Candidatus Thorarchaeota archaeon]|jgi:nucleoside-triphosphatase
MRKNVVLTGRPGIGKSTLIKKIIHALGRDTVGGFWSAEIRESNRRVGFSINTLSGETGVLAHVDLKTGPSVGKYRVNIEDLESIAVPALIRARRQSRIIVIDEIASMELYSPQFAPEVRKCLDTGRVLATLQQRRGGFQDEVRSRRDVHLIEITLANRDSLTRDVLTRLSG